MSQIEIFHQMISQRQFDMIISYNLVHVYYSNWIYLPKKADDFLIREENRTLAVAFNTTSRYIDNVLSINNCYYHFYVDSKYPSELEIKDIIESKVLFYI